MTFDELDQIFANAQAKNKKLKMWMGIIGVGIAAIGTALFFSLEQPDGAYILWGFAALFLVVMVPIIHVDGNKAMEKGQRLKQVLSKKPDQLVWIYVREEKKTNTGVVNIWVIIHLRDGTKIELHKDNLPNKDENTFLARMRETYNPQCILGYSDAIHRDYLDGKL